MRNIPQLRDIGVGSVKFVSKDEEEQHVSKLPQSSYSHAMPKLRNSWTRCFRVKGLGLRVLWRAILYGSHR